jgi:hypothetical protein
MRQVMMHKYILPVVAVLAFAACNHNPMSRLTLDNYNKITEGMSKAQVEQLLGPPTKTEEKQILMVKRTVYRYEDGTHFAEIALNGDGKVVSKESNLTTQ